MRTSVRLLRNTLFLSAAKVANPLLSMVLVLILSRDLGARGLGMYTTVLTLFTFFNILSVLGLNELIVREVAGNRSRVGKVVSNAFFLGIISSVFFSAAMVLTAKFLKYPSEVVNSVRVMGAALVFYTVSSYSQAFLQSFEKMEYCSFLLIAETVWKVFWGTIILKAGYSVFWVIVAVASAHLVSMIMGLVFVNRHISRLKFKIDFKFIRSLLRQVPTFFTLYIVVMIYWNMDVLMLSKMRGMLEVGYYSAAYRILSIGKSLTNCYIIAIFPVISHLYVNARNKFSSSCIRSMKYLFVFTLPVAIVTTILANPFLSLLYGKAFLESTRALQVLIWTLVLFPIANIMGNALIASHHQKVDLLVNTIGAVVNILLNFLLIPRFGYLGAGIATLISIALFISIQYWFVSRALFKIHYSKVGIKVLLAGIGMTVFMIIFNHMNMFLLSFLGFAIYGSLLFLMRSFSKEEIDMAKSIWKDKKMLFSLKS